MQSINSNEIKDENNSIKYYRKALILIAGLYLVFALFFNHLPNIDDPMPLTDRIIAVAIFLIIFTLSYLNKWVKERIETITYVAIYLALAQLIYLNYINKFEFGLAASLIVVLAVVNLFVKGKKIILYFNILLGLGVIIAFIFLEESHAFFGGYLLAYFSTSAITYYNSYKKYETEKRLTQISLEYETIFNNVQNAIFLINVDEKNEFRYQKLNELHENLTGLKTEEVKDKTPVEAVGKELGKEVEKKYRRCFKKRETIIYEEELDLPGGKKYWLTKLTPVISRGKVEKIVGTSLDITERKKQEKKIEHLSFHDHLTDLYNRRYFQNEIKRLNNSRKLPISIIVGDIDGLKYINDNYGHQLGDKYIKDAAKLFKNGVREEDIVARIGGDEFSVILPETDENTAAEICERILNEFSKYNQEDELPKKLQTSIGFATKINQKDNLSVIFDKADKDMYKNKGRRED